MVVLLRLGFSTGIITDIAGGRLLVVCSDSAQSDHEMHGLRLALNTAVCYFDPHSFAHHPRPASTIFAMRSTLSILAILLFVSPPASSEDVDFNRDVRTILSDACFTCHGPDPGQRQADLRLDLKEGIFQSLDGTTIVDPGKPSSSELLKRITSDDPDVVMPPHDGGRKLSEKEVSTIKQWIDQGAEWKGHWAYIAPQRPAVPDVEVGAGNEIDKFIDAALANAKTQPLAEATPVTLARRLAFDLTGLPPSEEAVNSFTASPTAERWNALTDEFLQSHRYAERMTAFWLDLVRYADTNGIHGDNHRDVWMYRDWVINAFHRNMPFDQFTIEQLAGDLLPNATDEQKIASGYNRLLMTTREGGAQAREYLAKYSADRVRNASTVWMGATMGCCECHDHKFDPYSIKDFYSFAAFFADIKDVPVGVQPEVKMPSAEQKIQQAALDTKMKSLQANLDTQTPELDAALNAWATGLKTKRQESPQTWQTAVVSDMKSDNGQTLKRQNDGQILTTGTHPKRDVYRIAVKPPVGKVTGIRLETFADKSFTKASLSRPPGNGNFVLSSVSATLVKAADNSEIVLSIKDAVASFEQKGWPVSAVLDGDAARGWAVDGHNSAKSPVAVFRLAAAAEIAKDDRILIELHHEAIDYHNIGKFRLSTTGTDDPGIDANTYGLPAELIAVVDAWPETDKESKALLATHFRTITPLLADVRANLKKVTEERDRLEKQIPETLITKTQKPRTIKVLARGDWMDDAGEVVNPAVPHFLNQLATEGRASRLELSQWFIDKQNPLVARVFVNRLWKLFFGKGLVKSADDFGSQGSWPTHPRLLDWLAIEFQESGWDVQHMIRLIVASNAYKRSSVATPELQEADPFNNLLARQSRFRLDAEFIRDNALAVSGLLVDQVGGPSVKPYQPEGYWAHLNFPKRAWQADKGDNQHRRGVYTYWCRTFLHPAMRSFDAPSREECTVDRPRSNNSLQALVLLNDPSFVEAARGLATQTIKLGGASTKSRIQFMYQRCLSRKPRENELPVLISLANSQLDQFTAAPETAVEFLTIGQSKDPVNGDAVEIAAWTAVARVVLNLHEVITRM